MVFNREKAESDFYYGLFHELEFVKPESKYNRS